MRKVTEGLGIGKPGEMELRRTKEMAVHVGSDMSGACGTRAALWSPPCRCLVPFNGLSYGMARYSSDTKGQFNTSLAAGCTSLCCCSPASAGAVCLSDCHVQWSLVHLSICPLVHLLVLHCAGPARRWRVEEIPSFPNCLP